MVFGKRCQKTSFVNFSKHSNIHIFVMLIFFRKPKFNTVYIFCNIILKQSKVFAHVHTLIHALIYIEIKETNNLSKNTQTTITFFRNQNSILFTSFVILFKNNKKFSHMFTNCFLKYSHLQLLTTTHWFPSKWKTNNVSKNSQPTITYISNTHPIWQNKQNPSFQMEKYSQTIKKVSIHVFSETFNRIS
jgi:hypothetical protein